MSSSLGWILLGVLGVVFAGVMFLIFGFLAIFLAGPVIAVYEDVEGHRKARPTPAPTPVGRAVLRH